MHPELQSLVEANTLTSAIASILDALPPGAYCQHKSWGFGRIASWNLADNQVLIDFGTRKNHPMQLLYAAETLQPIPAEHILAQKAKDLPGMKRLATEDIPGLVRLILQHAPGNRTNAAHIGTLLVPDVFSETEFKRWWETAKKALKKDGGFIVPAKKTDFIEAHSSEHGTESIAKKLATQFHGARQPKQQLATLDTIAKHLDEFREDLDVLHSVLASVARIAVQNQRLTPSSAFELLVARDGIVLAAGIELPAEAPTLTTFLQGNDNATLSEMIDTLPATRQRQALSTLPHILGQEVWVKRALFLLSNSRNSRVVAELVRLLESHGKVKEWQVSVDQSIRDFSVTCEMLFWICRERKTTSKPLIEGKAGLRLFQAILSALDKDRYSDIRRGTKLRDLLISDRELICDLLATGEPGELRAAARALLGSPAFDELDRRSLLARLIKVHPVLRDLLSGSGDEKQPSPLIVSWSSLEKKKEEYEELVNKKIPENSKEIGVARSYGDLRENFEFKAAKEMQAVLLRRKGELEIALGRARGTNFENPDTSQVSMGTIIKLSHVSEGKDKKTKDAASKKDGHNGNQQETYTLLGAWDGDPDKHIISYQTAIGQALLGHKIGEIVELPEESGTHLASRRVKIEAIEAYKIP